MSNVRAHVTIIDFAAPGYRVRTARSYPPGTLRQYQERAALRESFAMGDHEAEYLFVGVTPNSRQWPVLVVEQRFNSHRNMFNPSVLIVPQTHTVFIGAGTRLLSYALEPEPRRLWEQETEVGFFEWQLRDEVVLMSAELEFAAWSAGGEKLWSAFVEPPWSFTVDAGEVELEVMGSYSRFSLVGGPPHAP
jgi:hypothetical protein